MLPNKKNHEKIFHGLLISIGMLWASPMSFFGGVLGFISLGLGGHRPRVDGPMLVFNRCPFGPGGALTLGQVILHTGADLNCMAPSYRSRVVPSEHHHAQETVALAAHERAHVYQYFVLGPLFLPLYFFCGGISYRNRFEQAADFYARHGHGWWPWPRRN